MAAVRGTRRRAWLGAVLGCGAALLAGCATPTVGAGAPAVPSSRPVRDGARDPEEASTERAVPLYYVTDTPAGPRLAREFRRVPVDTDPGTAAVTALFAAPTGAVPEHRNTWPAGSALAAPVTHADGVVTVDLTAQAVDTTAGRPDPGRPAARLHRHRRVGHHGPRAGARRREAGRPPVGRRGRHLPARGAGRSPRHPGSGRHRRSRRRSVRALPGADRGGGGGVRGDAAVGDPAERVGRAVRQRRRPRKVSGSRRTPSRSSCRRATTRSASPRTTRPTAPGARS